ISGLDRLAELMENLQLLTTELSLNYVNVRSHLASSTKNAKDQIDVQAKNATETHDELKNEQDKHVKERASLMARVDQYQSENDKMHTDIANLNQRLKQQEEDFASKQKELSAIIREKRDQLEKKETILDHPDGYITFVSYEQNEVQLSINRLQGARPQMV